MMSWTGQHRLGSSFMKYKKSKCRQCKKEIIVPNTKSNGYLCEDCKIKNIENKKKRENSKYRFICPPRKCKACGELIFYDWRKDINSRRRYPIEFCSNSCAKRYSSLNNKDKTKIIKCIECGEEIEVPNNCSLKIKCNDCKEKHKVLKKYSVPKRKEYLDLLNLYPEDCNLGRFIRSQAYKQKSSNLARIGFDFKGNLEEEFRKTRDLLYKEYFENKLSIIDLKNKFGFRSLRTPTDMLKLFGFSNLRNISEGVKLSFRLGKNSPINEISSEEYKFKHGWIETQFGRFYYRSSYELNLIEFLDKNNIEFTCNEYKINYVSSKDNLIHVGYPDFYLPDYNLIIETKCMKFFDKTDLEDRYQEIKKRNLDYIIIRFEKKIEVLLEFIEINKKEEIYELLGVI